MDDQDRVAAFIDEYGLKTDLAYHALDLESEVGEIAKEVTTSTDYGRNPNAASIATDEIGDALFALLALAKYEARIESTGDAGSGQ